MVCWLSKSACRKDTCVLFTSCCLCCSGFRRANYSKLQNPPSRAQAEGMCEMKRWGHRAFFTTCFLVNHPRHHQDPLLCCFQESPKACAERSSAVLSESAELFCGCSPCAEPWSCSLALPPAQNPHLRCRQKQVIRHVRRYLSKLSLP